MLYTNIEIIFEGYVHYHHRSCVNGNNTADVNFFLQRQSESERDTNINLPTHLSFFLFFRIILFQLFFKFVIDCYYQGYDVKVCETVVLHKSSTIFELY